MSALDLEEKVKATLTQAINDRATMYYKTLFDDEYNPGIDASIMSLTKLLHDINVATTPLKELYDRANKLGINARYNVAVFNIVAKTGNLGELDAIKRITGNKAIPLASFEKPLNPTAGEPTLTDAPRPPKKISIKQYKTGILMKYITLSGISYKGNVKDKNLVDVVVASIYLVKKYSKLTLLPNLGSLKQAMTILVDLPEKDKQLAQTIMSYEPQDPLRTQELIKTIFDEMKYIKYNVEIKLY